MNKLTKRFYECILAYMNKKLQAVECANECKKIAIDFKTYYMQQPKRIINLVELPDGISIEDFIRQHDELEFDKFIEENYE